MEEIVERLTLENGIELHRTKECTDEVWKRILDLANAATSLKEIMTKWVLEEKQRLKTCPGYHDEKDIHTSVCLMFNTPDTAVYLFYPIEKARDEFGNPKVASEYVTETKDEAIKFQEPFEIDEESLDERDSSFGIEYDDALAGYLGKTSIVFEHLSPYFLDAGGRVSFEWMDDISIEGDILEEADFNPEDLLWANINVRLDSFSSDRGITSGFGASVYYLDDGR
ncbi:MAG: hypothetical protein D6808_05500 [Candidatus Dadabacteria bacterium]|nr:MAG: hypothetical protein D6808_05500 [Candidatus Dadabacteria bacterium]